MNAKLTYYEHTNKRLLITLEFDNSDKAIGYKMNLYSSLARLKLNNQLLMEVPSGSNILKIEVIHPSSHLVNPSIWEGWLNVFKTIITETIGEDLE